MTPDRSSPGSESGAGIPPASQLPTPFPGAADDGDFSAKVDDETAVVGGSMHPLVRAAAKRIALCREGSPLGPM